MPHDIEVSGMATGPPCSQEAVQIHLKFAIGIGYDRSERSSGSPDWYRCAAMRLHHCASATRHPRCSQMAYQGVPDLHDNFVHSLMLTINQLGTTHFLPEVIVGRRDSPHTGVWAQHAALLFGVTGWERFTKPPARLQPRFGSVCRSPGGISRRCISCL